MNYGRKENFNFRELTQGLVLIVNDRNITSLRRIFENKETDNSILACAYIDHEAGISFEVLCLGEYGPNGEITLSRGNNSTSFKLRYDAIDGIVVLLDDQIMPSFQWKIDMVRRDYQVNEAIMQVRNIHEIDKFRHPQFPDDILLYFFKENVRTEQIWCRVESGDGDYYAAELLNEPYNPAFGVHFGDLINWGWVETENGIIALAIV